VRLLPFDDDRAARILSVLPESARHASVHAADERGLASATEAFRLILTRLRGGRALAAMGLYRIYPWVVRNRSHIGRFVPNLPRPPVS
jgi:hypothetical protein